MIFYKYRVAICNNNINLGNILYVNFKTKCLIIITFVSINVIYYYV